jgi:hypothetical protein
MNINKKTITNNSNVWHTFDLFIIFLIIQIVSLFGIFALEIRILFPCKLIY